MPAALVTIGPWTVSTYSFAIALGICLSAGFGVYRTRTAGTSVVDVYLGGLVGGILLARLIHVLLWWDYFAYNLNEAVQINAGGLDWHGAVIGALIGMKIVASLKIQRKDAESPSRWSLFSWRSRRLGGSNFADYVDSLTIALPLIALGGWFGCWSATCAYGAEVSSMADYPASITIEEQDIFGIYAPRFHTHLIGMAFSVTLLLVAGLMMFSSRLQYHRFWIVLALLSVGMFTIGFLRGDYALRLAGLRFDQWLDVAIVVGSILWLTTKTRRTRSVMQLLNTE